MANESIIAVPADISNPLILRRFLDRLVERLDIVIGNRQGSPALLEAQQALIDEVNSLTSQLQEAELSLADAIVKANELLEYTADTFNKEIIAIQQDISDLTDRVQVLEDESAFTTSKGYKADITGALGVTNSYNHSTVTNSVTGQYDITLTQSTFDSNEVIANSRYIVSTSIPVSTTFTRLSATQFRISVYDFTSTLVNLGASDILFVGLMYNKPGAGLPSS